MSLRRVARGRLFRQVYAAVLGAVLLSVVAATLVRFLEPRRQAPADGAHARHVLALHWLVGLAVVAAAAGAAAYPLARRLTGRIERLRDHVDRLGGGALEARVPVEGDDEVAELAGSFNRAAERIEALVRAQRELLAHVSHELRTPLARLRIGVELLDEQVPADARRQVIEDVDELDALVGELLTVSRLASGAPLERVEDVDMLGLVAEEAARSGAEVSGEPVHVEGDARLLRRLVRNLLENARSHGGGQPVEAEVRGDGGSRARLAVSDRGPGVPEADRERIFEPFHRLAGATGKGAGLGLALVRQIAHRHGGDVRCLPREGGGTRFEVRLHTTSRDGKPGETPAT
jgi:signal transduction histidine kinase